MIEWQSGLCSSLQSYVHWFDSSLGLFIIKFSISSTAERSAVNRMVVGSNPA